MRQSSEKVEVLDVELEMEREEGEWGRSGIKERNEKRSY